MTRSMVLRSLIRIQPRGRVERHALSDRVADGHREVELDGTDRRLPTDADARALLEFLILEVVHGFARIGKRLPTTSR